MTGIARDVAWWPALAAPDADGLVLLGIAGAGERETARLQIREALRETLARLAGLPAGAIMIHSGGGRAPAVSFSAPARIAPPGIAISHEAPLSVAAIHLHGAVGIDLMREQDIPDWLAVARDYLGPRVLDSLSTLAPPARMRALACAWTEREARLKCRGRPLEEWDAADPVEDSLLRCLPLTLPPGFTGTVALGR